jgi:hypothetical protein
MADQDPYSEFQKPSDPYAEFGGSATPVPPMDLRQMGPIGAMDQVLQGVGSGVSSTAIGTYNVVRKGAKKLGLRDLPEPPASLTQAATDQNYDAAGNPVGPMSPLFRMGKTGEQIGEFFIPGGAISDATKFASQYGKVAEVGARILSEGASASAVAGLQTGGDKDAMERAALTAGMASGAFSTIGSALKAVAPAAYTSRYGLKFPERFQTEQGRVGEILADAIKNRVLVSEGGAAKAGNLVKRSGAVTDAMIATHAGEPIDIKVAEDSLTEMRGLAARIGDNKLARQIENRWNDFLEAHGKTPGTPGTPSTTVTSPIVGPTGSPITRVVPGTPGKPPTPAVITVGEAQQLKQDFQTMASRAYGKLAGNKAELNKALARGQRESLEGIIPELKQANRTTQNRILLEDAIQKSMASQGSISPGVALAALINPTAGEALFLMRHPTVRSALGIISDRVGGSMKALAPGAARVGAQQSESMAPPIPQLDTSQIKVGP